MADREHVKSNHWTLGILHFFGNQISKLCCLDEFPMEFMHFGDDPDNLGGAVPPIVTWL